VLKPVCAKERNMAPPRVWQNATIDMAIEVCFEGVAF